ncbi:uncharacterized protein B0T23DRAFT_400202 [Neurospora hispaniola]|uniref:Gfd2/YDR514C-like C-terminal domain-containing protein n=1 Tax=Neurospora hispaniola TaxID=588809 RepID=A0AAJ0HY91_9PEZI|nr:hypothetical protein B0T23DRAFT_400202 [Neurospora hispaniola]
MASKEVQPTGRQVDEYLYEPPSVSSIQDLKDMYNQLKDTILVSIDFECVDHLSFASYYERLSEVGMSWYDPRDHRSPSRKFTVEKALPKIRSVHCIMRKYKNFTADSCFVHQTVEAKSHKAMPYSCYFAKSYFCNREKAMAIITNKMKWLSTRRLSRKETAAGKKRKVIVLYWDARLETSVFREAGVDITAHGAEQWDFQLLRLFHMRFRRPRNKAEEMLYSLGVSLASASSDFGSKGFAWHNATNDCWATVAGLLQILSMAQQTWKWKRWLEEEKSDDEWEMILWDNNSKERRAGTDLEALDMSWLDARKFKRNAALSPPPEKWPKDSSGQRNSRRYEVDDCICALDYGEIT